MPTNVEVKEEVKIVEAKPAEVVEVAAAAAVTAN